MTKDGHPGTCPECKRPDVPLWWTYDRYFIPWRKVCDACFNAVRDRIATFKHDEDDAGEKLDPED